MDQSLRDAAEQGNIDALYALIQKDAKVLDRIDEIPFVDTPLHTAAFAGHTPFVMEVMKLKPSFARKLNQHGFSPMHLALQNLHEPENNPDLQRDQTKKEKENQTQLVDRLLDVDSNLVRVQGRDNVTPLHYVAQIGNLDFLAKFFKACPESLEDVTIRKENAMHIALKYNMVKAFGSLLRLVERALFKDAILLEEKLLNSQDEDGNTLLHIAVSKNQPKVVSWLMDTGLVDLKAKNFEDHTVFDILENPTLTQPEADSQRMRVILGQGCVSHLAVLGLKSAGKQLRKKLFVLVRRQQAGMTNEKRNALLVVAVLILTVTYQAGLNPPADWKPKNVTDPTNPWNDPLDRLFNKTDLAQLRAINAWIDKNTFNGNAFLVLNTITYYLTNLTLFFLLPPDFSGLVHFLLLLLLSFCYCISTPLLNVPLIAIIGSVFTGLFLYFCLLVFRVTVRRVKHVSSN